MLAGSVGRWGEVRGGDGHRKQDVVSAGELDADETTADTVCEPGFRMECYQLCRAPKQRLQDGRRDDVHQVHGCDEHCNVQVGSERWSTRCLIRSGWEGDVKRWWKTHKMQKHGQREEKRRAQAKAHTGNDLSVG